jgi:hypothetical protein
MDTLLWSCSLMGALEALKWLAAVRADNRFMFGMLEKVWQVDGRGINR